MVIISAAICTRSGKPVVARQFVEISRLRVENLLAAFPKLVSPTKQHTYVESESVRYVFQSFEGLYLVLITTKNSNIVEDLDTLRLLSKVVSDACPAPTEDSVNEAAFQLVASFDEVISLGYREPITLQGIRTNLEMNSLEEKLSQMIRQSKETEAKQAMKQAAALLQKQKMSGAGGPGGRPVPGSMQGYGASSAPPPSAVAIPSTTASTSSTAAAAAAPKGKKPGLQLGKKKKDESVLEAMAAEDGIDSEALKEATAPSSLAVPGAVTVPKDPVTISVTETVSCTLKQDSSLASYEVSGQVSIMCRQEDMKCVVYLARDEKLADGFTFKTHPQVDKTMWEKNAILVNKARDRPISANTPFGALKYRSKPVSDVAQVPLSITVWPELASGGKATNVNVEYELQCDVELYNVTFVIPLSSQAEPEVLSVEGGVHRHNSRKQQLEWTIDMISPTSGKTGSLEFNLPISSTGGAGKSVDGSGFFPTTVTFTSNASLAGLIVTKVEVEGMPDLRFGVDIEVKSETYEVVMEE